MSGLLRRNGGAVGRGLRLHQGYGGTSKREFDATTNCGRESSKPQARKLQRNTNREMSSL